MKEYHLTRPVGNTNGGIYDYQKDKWSMKIIADTSC